MENTQQKFKDALYTSIQYTATTVSKDTQNLLNKFYENEKISPISSSQFKLMLENIQYANENLIPVCQDTGHVNLFIQIGENFPHILDFHTLSQSVLEKLTADTILRPNTVDPLTQKNQKNNLGSNMPPIYIEIVPKSMDLTVSILNKGGGSENMSQLFMLNPATGLEDLIPIIVNHMKKAGGKPCPPTILGIGIGGDACKSMYYAKKSLFRPIGERHPRKDVSKLEELLYTELNNLNIGVMGLGGKSTCLDVKIEISMRHPATFPVGLVVECYCHRTRSFQVTSNGVVKFGDLDSHYKFVEGI